jgi:hypothetical protein
MAAAANGGALPTSDPNGLLLNQGDPAVESVSSNGGAQDSRARTSAATPGAAQLFGRSPGEMLIWVGVMVGGIAIIGMLAWLIRQYRGSSTTP